MATYKVLQDIEAEDKILGPLTLRQFIYTLITAFLIYLCVVSVANGFPWALIFLAPFVLTMGFLAFPFRRDQPTEVWAIAKIGFLFQPRRRIWDQSGVKELVTITVPKKVERVYTNGLSQTEVQSRLSALANTIDSRGWAIKNVNVNLYAQPAMVSDEYSDRLVAMSSMPQAVPEVNIQPSDDMLDADSSPIAQQFTQMINAKEQAHRQQIMETMNGNSSATPSNSGQWFVPPEPNVIEPATPNAPTMAEAAVPTAEDIALIEKIKAENEASNQSYNSHLRNVVPLSEQQPQEQHLPLLESVKSPEPAPTVTEPQHNQKFDYLPFNDDRSIESLAREMKQSKPKDDPGEVVISWRR